MKIGDKVRYLHDNIEGVVTKIVNETTVEIMDTFGFDFPALKKDLIIVNPIEDEFFNKEEGTSVEIPETEINQVYVESKGIYLAFVQENKNIGLYLINNTAVKTFMSVYKQKKDTLELLGSEMIKTKSSVRIGLYPLSEIDSWKKIHLSFQKIVPNTTKHLKLEANTIVIKSAKIINAVQDIPFVDKKGYLKQIDDFGKLQDKKILENSLNESNDWESVGIKLDKPNKEVDLHAEKLGIDTSRDNSEILSKQLRVFKESFEGAITHSMKEITFIHGIGNGVLRDEIHRQMKNYTEVAFFEDTNRGTFGYGATKITFK